MKYVRELASIVEDVVLIGTPCFINRTSWVEAQTGSLAAPIAEVEVAVVPVADDSTPPIQRDLLAEVVGWSYSDL